MINVINHNWVAVFVWEDKEGLKEARSEQGIANYFKEHLCQELIVLISNISFYVIQAWNSDLLHLSKYSKSKEKPPKFQASTDKHWKVIRERIYRDQKKIPQVEAPVVVF